jgi:hypothetical protein
MQAYTPSKEVATVQHPHHSSAHQPRAPGATTTTIMTTTTSTVLGELPPAVRAAAVLRDPVIAWTKLDPALADRVCCQACCLTFGTFLIVPCFWPHLLCMWPCLLVSKMAWENRIYSQYWILTERELKVVTMDYATSCCASSGNQVKSIPLENITDCGVDSVGQGCLNQCYDSLPNIYVDTASSYGGNAVAAGAGVSSAHEAIGTGLYDHATFIRRILDQRDVLKSGGRFLPQATSTTPAMAVATIEPMHRGGGMSVTDRLKQVQELYDAGVISKTEYETNRRDVLSGI